MKFSVALFTALSLAGFATADAADISWTNTGGSAWLTTTNWQGSIVPTGTDVAIFGPNPTGSGGAGINFANATNNGTQNQAVGAIVLDSSRTSGNPVIGNSSSTAGKSGTLTLNGATVNGISDVVLRNLSSQNLTIQNTQGSGNQTMDVALADATNNIISLDGGGNIVISSIIKDASGNKKLTISGTGGGRVDLTAANTFSGGLFVMGGEVRVTTDSSIGAASNNITVDGGRFGIVSGGAVTVSSSRDILLGSTAGTSISAPGAGGILTYNGVFKDLSTGGILVKQGAGVLAVGGVSTYTGSTSINNGSLQLTSGNDRLPTGTVVSIGQVLSTNSGTLDLNGFSQQVAGLVTNSGTGAVTGTNSVISSSSATLTINTGSGTNYTYGGSGATSTGVISGAISVVKSGSGSQTFGGANSYTGSTTINAGSLILSGSGKIGSGNLALGGGTFDISGITPSTYSLSSSQSLTGAGTIKGSGGKSLAVAGILAPGNSPGSITLDTINLTLSGTSNFQFTDTSLAGGTYDLVAGMAGGGAESVTFGGVLNVDFSGGTYGNFSLKIFDVDSYSGSFSSLNTTGLQVGQTASFDASNGTLTVVPEPSTYALLFVSVGMVLWGLRRRSIKA